MCAFTNNCWKCVNSKYLRIIMLLYAWEYILEPSRERSIIKKHLWWGAFLMLLLIAECDFTEEKILLQTFPNKSSKTDYQKNNTTTFCKASDFF